MNAAVTHAALPIAAFAFASLWQGVAIVVLARLVLCSPRLGATTKAAVWLTALGAIVVLPLLTVVTPSLSLVAPPQRAQSMRSTFAQSSSHVASGSPTTIASGALDVAGMKAVSGTQPLITLRMTIDATGRAHDVVAVSGPAYALRNNGLKMHGTVSTATYFAYDPATRDCKPVAATITTAAQVGPPNLESGSGVDPEYPVGFSAAHPGACKVPSLIHMGVPAFPPTHASIAIGKRYDTQVRVAVDASGRAKNAAVMRSSGDAVFDDALVASARAAHYPLAEEAGFHQVRPGKAPITWNQTHGSPSYLGCTPAPTGYLWRTFFTRDVGIGIPGVNSTNLRLLR